MAFVMKRKSIDTNRCHGIGHRYLYWKQSIKKTWLRLQTVMLSHSECEKSLANAAKQHKVNKPSVILVATSGWFYLVLSGLASKWDRRQSFPKLSVVDEIIHSSMELVSGWFSCPGKSSQFSFPILNSIERVAAACTMTLKYFKAFFYCRVQLQNGSQMWSAQANLLMGVAQTDPTGHSTSRSMSSLEDYVW